MSHNGAVRNRLLLALPAVDFRAFAEKLEPVELQAKQVVIDIDRPIAHLYFPETCVVSIVTALSDRTSVETATIGNEGMVGLPVFLGSDRTTAQAFAQVPGRALRMRTEDFGAMIGELPVLTDVLHRYTQALFTMVAQTSACNRIHMMTERCARWLLHTHDRVPGPHFPLTHQFLSQMLGVRRATVTEAMGALQQSGVAYNNGLVTITDRLALESVACECYHIVTSEFDRLLLREPKAHKNPLKGMKASEHGRTTLKQDVIPDEPDLEA
jgi:CRP-like cAMP-binding protein